MKVMYSFLSDCALSARTAGPLEEFSVFIWIYVASVTIPITPPNASISLTRHDFAGPPTAGLHGISAILSRFSVIKRVLSPSFAALMAASHPAWPEPTIIKSNLNICKL